MQNPYVALPGTTRGAPPGAQVQGPVDPQMPIEVTIRVRRAPGQAAPRTVESLGAALPRDRQYLAAADLAGSHGADPADLAAVAAFAEAHGLAIVASSAEARTVKVAGTAAALEGAFQTQLMNFSHPTGEFHARVGQLHVPANLVQVICGVFGLDNRQAARPYVIAPAPGIARALGPSTSFTPLELGQFYNFPPGDGAGQCIGILEFGGGYDAGDLQTYFTALGVPLPQVQAVSVDGATNAPGGPTDAEVMMDIEVAGALAPGARIVVYFAPWTSRGWIDALTTAIHDRANAPAIISISWGFAEGLEVWTPTLMNEINEILQTAAQLGITVIAAAGDDGSADEETDGRVHVDFPASSPYILGCGGTSLTPGPAGSTREVVWNTGLMINHQGASGGGISDVWPLPAWQAGAHVPPSANPGGRVGRGVPDVAADADANTGYVIRTHGVTQGGYGGTSAVAPLMAGLIARINTHLGVRVGYFNPLLYTRLGPHGVFRDITVGTNDPTPTHALHAYAAGPGWDACTGWGSPDGAKLLQALGGG